MKLRPFRRYSLLFTKSIPISSLFRFPLPPQRCSLPFSTSFTPNHPRSSHPFDDVVPGLSAVYHHALKFQPPAAVKWAPQLENTANFIGSVTLEPKIVKNKTGKFGVHTMLKVRRSNQPNSSSFWVLLKMWGCVAEFACKHLKPNDFVHVSGCLGSYTKADDSGNLLVRYELVVKELNFVAQRLGYQDREKEKSNEDIDEAGIQNDQNRLYLWQVFFASPNEWWDQRKRKRNPKQPDFKHKDTGESLWLSNNDPPWVKKQLQLLDSKMEGGFVGHRSRVANWFYDE